MSIKKKWKKKCTSKVSSTFHNLISYEKSNKTAHENDIYALDVRGSYSILSY